MGLKNGGLRGSLRNIGTSVGIPDSEADQKLIHRWVLDDVNGTVEDSVGNADGTNNGISSISGDWLGGSAGEGDGLSHISTSTLGAFGSALTTDFAIAYSFTTTATSLGRVTAVGNSADSTALYPAIDNGVLTLPLSDSSGNIIGNETNSATFNDGEQYRVVLNKKTNDPSNFEIWVNQVEEATSVSVDQGFNTTTDFDEDLALFAWNNSGSIAQQLSGVLDDICIFDDSLTQLEIGSYENPWP